MHLSAQERIDIAKQVTVYAGKKPLFFSRILYDKPTQVFDLGAFQLKKGSSVVLLTAIADNNVFKAEVAKDYVLDRSFVFEDHHGFTSKDLDGLQAYIAAQEKSISILTTEKDMVRLLSLSDHSLFKLTPVYYIPIRFVLEEEEKFKETLLKVVEQKKNLN